MRRGQWLHGNCPRALVVRYSHLIANNLVTKVGMALEIMHSVSDRNDTFNLCLFKQA